MMITPGLPKAGLSPKRVGKKRVAMSPSPPDAHSEHNHEWGGHEVERNDE
jgi:hypothetical protein